MFRSASALAVFSGLLLASIRGVSADPGDGLGTETIEYLGATYCSDLGTELYAYTDGVNTYCGCFDPSDLDADAEPVVCDNVCSVVSATEDTSTDLALSSAFCTADTGGLCFGTDAQCETYDTTFVLAYSNSCATGESIGTDGTSCFCTTDAGAICAGVENGYASCSVSNQVTSDGTSVAGFPSAFCTTTCAAGYTSSADGSCVLAASAAARKRGISQLKQSRNRQRNFVF